MKKIMMASLFTLTTLTAHAGNPDLYICQGPGIKLQMVLDWFGKGLTESIKGTIQGKTVSFSPDQSFRHPRKLDPDYRYIFYKDPGSDLIIKMASPTEETLPDYYYSGYVLLNGKEISIDCLNPTYR